MKIDEVKIVPEPTKARTLYHLIKNGRHFVCPKSTGTATFGWNRRQSAYRVLTNAYKSYVVESELSTSETKRRNTELRKEYLSEILPAISRKIESSLDLEIFNDIAYNKVLFLTTDGEYVAGTGATYKTLENAIKYVFGISIVKFKPGVHNTK